MGGLYCVSDSDNCLPDEQKPIRVLLAEDNPALAQVTRFNLERAGYQVIAALDGRAAWQTMQQEAFDVLVTDQQMPEMTGLELCAKLRTIEAHRHTPAILLTAKCLEMDHRRLESELGISRVLGKPFSPRQLVDTLGQLLRVPQGSG